ncbi:MAG: type II toxin-antitoxin system RelE/ParE family toxin [Spirochaetota bacterium]
MTRTFVESKEFQSRWKALGMTEDDLRELQSFLLEHPGIAPVIQGTGGVRKLRWAREGRGKSGSLRTIYLDMRASGLIYLITVFGKDEKDSLSAEEKRAIKAYVKGLLGE